MPPEYNLNELVFDICALDHFETPFKHAARTLKSTGKDYANDRAKPTYHRKLIQKMMELNFNFQVLEAKRWSPDSCKREKREFASGEKNNSKQCYGTTVGSKTFYAKGFCREDFTCDGWQFWLVNYRNEQNTSVDWIPVESRLDMKSLVTLWFWLLVKRERELWKRRYQKRFMDRWTWWWHSLQKAELLPRVKNDVWSNVWTYYCILKQNKRVRGLLRSVGEPKWSNRAVKTSF